MENALKSVEEGPEVKIPFDSLKKYQTGKIQSLIAYKDYG